jgi:hypothetical protein
LVDEVQTAVAERSCLTAGVVNDGSQQLHDEQSRLEEAVNGRLPIDGATMRALIAYVSKAGSEGWRQPRNGS